MTTVSLATAGAGPVELSGPEPRRSPQRCRLRADNPDLPPLSSSSCTGEPVTFRSGRGPLHRKVLPNAITAVLVLGTRLDPAAWSALRRRPKVKLCEGAGLVPGTTSARWRVT